MKNEVGTGALQERASLGGIGGLGQPEFCRLPGRQRGEGQTALEGGLRVRHGQLVEAGKRLVGPSRTNLSLRQFVVRARRELRWRFRGEEPGPRSAASAASPYRKPMSRFP